MQLLTTIYLAQNKWLALTGAGMGLASAAVVYFSPQPAYFAGAIGLGLLKSPISPKRRQPDC